MIAGAIAGVVLTALTVALVLLALLTGTGRYLVRAGWEEGKILAGRRPIVGVIADPSTSPSDRAALRLVLAARAFAADSLGLRAKASFTTYVACAATRWFSCCPGRIAINCGRIRGGSRSWATCRTRGSLTFRPRFGRRAIFGRRGSNAYVRPSPAFSTLGFFNDPVLSTSLGSDSIYLANTVIHELTHNTFYPAGQAVFNESFANFVGSRGAAAFFRSRGDSGAAALADARWVG